MGRSSELKKIAVTVQISKAMLRFGRTRSITHMSTSGLTSASTLAAVRHKKLAKCQARRGRILWYSHSNSEGSMFRMNSERPAAIQPDGIT
jgi:hypothetical protein